MKLDFAFLGLDASGHQAALVRIQFVLHGDGLYRHALRGIGLQKLEQIPRVRSQVMADYGLFFDCYSLFRGQGIWLEDLFGRRMWGER